MVNYTQPSMYNNLVSAKKHFIEVLPSAGLTLQSLIAGALDSYVAMASIDLRVAFDVVDTKLLIKRLKVIGLERLFWDF